jgi:uncharacterized protein YkwD
VGLAEGLVERMNELRADHGLRPVTVSARLEESAAEHAVAMAKRGVFAHSTDGRSFATRIARHYPRRSGRSWSVGENLCFGTLDFSAAACLGLWLASPPHRRNLLDAAWRELGVAALAVRSAPGDFGGLDTTLVVVDFGARG